MESCYLVDVNLSAENTIDNNDIAEYDLDICGVVDTSPYPVFIHNQGIVKYANILAKKLVGLQAEDDINGLLIASFVHADDLPKLQHVLKAQNESPRISDTMEFRLSDTMGNTRMIQGKSTAIRFKGELCRLFHVYNFDLIEQVLEEVYEKQVLLDKLVEVLPDSLIVVNSITHKQLYNNKSFARQLGYDEEDFNEGEEYAFVLEKIHPDDMPKMNAMRAFLNDPDNAGKMASVEYRVLNKAEKWRWVLGRSSSLMPTSNGQGRINFNIVQDITELRENQNELESYKSFQEKVNNTSPVIVTLFEIDRMTSVYRSKDMAKWFGYDPDKFPERTVELVHPEYREDVRRSIMKVAALSDQEIETTVYPFLTGDGNIKFILTRSAVFQRDQNGKATHILMAHSDITDLKETESKLDKSEETRRAILYAIPDMLATVHRNGDIINFYPNEMLREEMKGVQIAGHNIREYVSGQELEELFILINETIIHSQLNTFHFEYTSNNKTSYYELRISPFSIDEVVILCRDISDQKVGQDKIDHYNKELFEKNQELERYITSNSELEKFAYIASHDLREPLRSLIGFAQLLQKRNAGKLPRESEEFIENIIHGAQRMNTLVSSLLEYSRVTSNGKPFANVSLTEIIKKVQSDLKISLEENNAEILLFDIPGLYCDELQIRQLFQNLISNSIKFRSAQSPIIKISAEKLERHWLFKVQDNGIGIDMKFKDQIFQIFSRLHSQDKYQGSGIGLSVCKKIIERHGGQIWIESTPGKGATINFTILQ